MRFEPHVFDPWWSQTNDIHIDTFHHQAWLTVLLGYGKVLWNEEDQLSMIEISTA